MYISLSSSQFLSSRSTQFDSAPAIIFLIEFICISNSIGSLAVKVLERARRFIESFVHSTLCFERGENQRHASYLCPAKVGFTTKSMHVSLYASVLTRTVVTLRGYFKMNGPKIRRKEAIIVSYSFKKFKLNMNANNFV